jgi:hypothetical protein
MLLGCAALPPQAAESALYQDLRRIVEVNEDSGWILDSTRLRMASEPALRSVCQVEPRVRQQLDAWLGAEIERNGGPSQQAFLRNGHHLSAVATTLSLERTRLLLRAADRQADQDCPFWLAPSADFTGEQGSYRRWVGIGETQAFGTVEIPGPVPALGGGARLLLGRGITPRLTLALGADAAASGTFIPSSQNGGGIDAYVTLAMPLLLRFTGFARLVDVELAPVARFARGQTGWPPGGRLELGYGFASIRQSAFMSYYTIYAGYELHGFGDAAGVDHTVQLGTKLSVDFMP